MEILRVETKDGKSWAFTRSDGLEKLYVLTVEGNRATIVHNNRGQLYEVRYNGRLLKGMTV